MTGGIKENDHEHHPKDMVSQARISRIGDDILPIQENQDVGHCDQNHQGQIEEEKWIGLLLFRKGNGQ
jgi:hypothetical protein